MLFKFCSGEKGRARKTTDVRKNSPNMKKKERGDGGEIGQMTTRHGGRGRNV